MLISRQCDPGTPCKNCQDDPDRCSDPTMVAWQPCFRLDLDDCGVFRNSKPTTLPANPHIMS